MFCVLVRIRFNAFGVLVQHLCSFDKHTHLIYDSIEFHFCFGFVSVSVQNWFNNVFRFRLHSCFSCKFFSFSSVLIIYSAICCYCVDRLLLLIETLFAIVNRWRVIIIITFRNSHTTWSIKIINRTLSLIFFVSFYCIHATWILSFLWLNWIMVELLMKVEIGDEGWNWWWSDYWIISWNWLKLLLEVEIWLWLIGLGIWFSNEFFIGFKSKWEWLFLLRLWGQVLLLTRCWILYDLCSWQGLDSHGNRPLKMKSKANT